MSEETKTIAGNEPEVTVDNEVVTPEAKPEVDNTPTELDYSKLLTSAGGFADNWREFLPEDIRQEKCLDNVKHIGTLAKNYVNAQKMVGANKIAIPGENATQAELDEFYNKLGRPEKAESYSTDGITLPQGVQLDSDTIKEFKEFAHQNGLSQKVFAAVVAFDAARAASAAAKAKQAADAEYDATLTRLQGDGNFQQTVAQCDKALSEFGLTEEFGRLGLLNNYTIITAMAKIGARISESRLITGSEVKATDPTSQLEEITSNFDDPYYHRDHPQHDARVQLVNDLLAKKSRLQKQQA